MISLTFDLTEFATRRRKAQEEIEQALAPKVRKALSIKEVTNGWDEVIEEVVVQYQRAYAAEIGNRPVEVPDQFLDRLTNTLQKAHRSESPTDDEVSATSIWLATAILSHSTIQAATDSSEELFLEWVDMDDEKVRPTHQKASGQQRPIGEHFDVGGSRMIGPGDVSAPIEEWINCRCTLRPVPIGEALVASVPDPFREAREAAQRIAHEYREVPTDERKRDADAGRALPDGSYPIDNCSDLKNAIQAIGRAKDPAKVKRHIRKRKNALGCPDVDLPDTWALDTDESDDRSHLSCIVALPSEDDEVHKYGEEQKHVTLVFLGEYEGDIEPIKDAVAGVAGSMEGLVALVAGTATLGPDKAKVWLVEDPDIETARKRLLDNTEVMQGKEAADSHPHFVPHMTITYDADLPDGVENVAEIAFDRLAVWHGEGQFEYPLGADMPKTDEKTQVGTAPDYERVPDEEAPPKPDEPLSETNAVPWFGPLAPEMIRSGDGRKFGKDSLTTRPLPMPLTWQRQSADGHTGNVTVAKIEKVRKIDGILWGSGHFIDNTEAAEVIGLIAEFGRFGVSVDADQSQFELDEDDDSMVFTEARVCSACIVPIPAFAEAWVALGEWPFEDEEEPAEGEVPEAVEREDDPAIAAGLQRMAAAVNQFVDVAPGRTEDGPGWLTHPVDTDRLRDYWVRGPGAAKIAWGTPGDFNRCRALTAEYVKPQHLNGYCANRHYDALGVWPGPGKRGHSGEALPFAYETLDLEDTKPAPSLSLVASVAPLKAPADWFANPEFEEPTPLTITDEGRVFGHIATWDSCHLNFPNECVNPPRSMTGYAHFLTGATHLDDGSVIPTGRLTVGGGHAADGLSMRAALAHYDDASTGVCDVTVGEDDIGIWTVGWVRPSATPEMVTALQASPLSGDWRWAGGNLEMIAAHAVNSPGFLVPRVRVAAAGDHTVSLVAAGALAPREEPKHEGIDMDELATKVAMQVIEIQERKQAMAALRDEFGGD